MVLRGIVRIIISQKLSQNHMSREHGIEGYCGDYYYQGASQKPIVHLNSRENGTGGYPFGHFS